MKKIMLIVIITVNLIPAQNIQFHYDLGQGRNFVTTTLEMFKPDEFGSTFFFIDFDFNFPGSKGISMAYFEIARYFNFYDKLSLTIQYNDGITVSDAVPVNYGFTLNQAWLGGISYPIDLGFAVIGTDLLYRKTYGSSSPDGQITFTWAATLLDGDLTLTGFMDIWTQDKTIRPQTPSEKQKEVVFLTQPQIWYLLVSHLSAGGELEISNNFLPYQEQIKVFPTIALKWVF